MDAVQILKYVAAISSFLIIVVVLLQTRSGGLGTVFGGSAGSDLYKSRRGFEAFLYNSTIILTIVLVVSSLGVAILTA